MTKSKNQDFNWQILSYYLSGNIKATKIQGKRVLKILSEAGDERLVWNKEYGQEAKEAKRKFNEFLAKGYKAYSVDSQGKKNRKIEEFDVDAEEILMIPATAKG